MTATENPYIVNNYAPVKEERTEIDLEVTGDLPAALNGMLLRDGPNPAGATTQQSHWFVGDGMVHAVELRDGEAVSYRNRWIRTGAVEASAGLPAAPTSPNDMGMGSGNVNIIEHAGHLLGLGEIGLPWELTPTLETVGQFDFDTRLTGSMTAHPKSDPVTGELVFFGYSPFGPPFLQYHRADAAGTLVQSEAIEIPQSTMMHDWGVTESRVVFMDLPVIFDMNMVTPDMGNVPYRWDDDTAARLGVMDRTGTSDEVVWVEIDPCYVFHPLNAYDDGDLIVMDVMRYPKMFASSKVGPHEPVLSSLHRWTIDVASGVVKEEQLDDRSAEFPRVDPRVVGRPHRWGYATELTGRAFDSGDLIRYDLTNGESVLHDCGPGRLPSEGVFVPASDDAEEGEGWVLSVVHDASTDRSDVIVIDAQDFTAPPVATVHLPVRVPFGFHGNWVPSA